MEVTEDLKKQILEKKCSTHPLMPCDLIHFRKKTKIRRICFMCAEENNYPITDIFSVKELMDASESSTLLTFPPLSS